MPSPSLRRQLLTRLLPGFLLLWAGAGTTIHLAVRGHLESRLDAELREIARALPFGNPAAASLVPLSLEDFASDDLGAYFEIWGEDGTRWLKSSNLGGFHLEAPAAFTDEGEFGNQVLGTGDPVRTFAFLGDGPGDLAGTPLHLMVAKTREPLDETLRTLLMGLTLIGLLGTVLFTALATWALRSGLKPLSHLGDQAARIDADSLAARFPARELPRELVPIAERLNDLMERLELSFHRERRFSADLAHELRNPVAALRSTAEVALRWPDRVSGEEFEDVHTIAGELQKTLENMLTLARLEKNETSLETEPVSLPEAVAEMRALFQARASERHLDIRIDLPEDLTVRTEPRLLRTILSNLVSNAVDYAPEGAVIAIAGGGGGISEGDQPSPWLSISNPAPHLDPDDLPRLFDRLWRHDAARSDSSHAGLGLSIARLCAEQLGAKLDAELDTEKRLVFRLVFRIG